MKKVIAVYVRNKIKRKLQAQDVELAGSYIQYAWYVVEPLLFGLIGALVDISKIQPSLIGNSVLVLILAVVMRGVGAYLATIGVLGHSERLFMAGAWIPKATVPAALSSEL